VANFFRNFDHVPFLSAPLGSAASYSEASSPFSVTSSSVPEVLRCGDCDTEFRGEYRQGNLNRHHRLYHGSYPCLDSICPRIFRRQEFRLKHHRRHHPSLIEQAPVSRRGPSLGLDTQSVLSLTTATGSHLEEEFTDRQDQPGADCKSPMVACHCSSSSKTSTNSTSRHVLNEPAGKLPDEWEEIQNQLPDDYEWDIEYVTTHCHSSCWTCAPLDDSGSIPLTIAEAPVVLPVEYQWPPVGLIRREARCRAVVCAEQVRVC
jgi:hypothetical protein